MSQSNVIRILDASLNRATEGLRVVEDYARFVLDDLLRAAHVYAGVAVGVCNREKPLPTR